jgi:hypothetical protein
MSIKDVPGAVWIFIAVVIIIGAIAWLSYDSWPTLQ